MQFSRLICKAEHDQPIGQQALNNGQRLFTLPRIGAACLLASTEFLQMIIDMQYMRRCVVGLTQGAKRKVWLERAAIGLKIP